GGRGAVVDRGRDAGHHVADEPLAVVVEVQHVAADRDDVRGQVDDVDPDRVGGERAVGQAHAPDVHVVALDDLVEGGRLELPDAGAVGDLDAVQGAVRAGHQQGGAGDVGDPALG